MSDSEIQGTGPAQGVSASTAAGAAGVPGAIPDCWNQKGIEGDGSCEELERYVHCRNCPVYANAGSQFLNRALPPGYKQAWTQHIAESNSPEARRKISSVIFRLGPEWLALPARAFREIAEKRPIHSIPHRTKGIVLGLANVRGELMVCVSMGRLLGLAAEAAEPTRSDSSRLLVCEWNGVRHTFPADEVHGVHRLHSAEIQPPPRRGAKSAVSFIQGVFSWRSNSVGLLEPETLFASLDRGFA